MISLGRREVLTGVLALGLGPALPAWASAAEPRIALFIADRRLSASAAAAARYQAEGAMVLDPRETDLGQAWRGEIPHRLAGGGRLAGLTLWSDLFICQTFAREQGLASGIVQEEEPDGAFRWLIV